VEATLDSKAEEVVEVDAVAEEAGVVYMVVTTTAVVAIKMISMEVEAVVATKMIDMEVEVVVGGDPTIDMKDLVMEDAALGVMTMDSMVVDVHIVVSQDQQETVGLEENPLEVTNGRRDSCFSVMLSTAEGLMNA
jgi:hypothetical protein